LIINNGGIEMPAKITIEIVEGPMGGLNCRVSTNVAMDAPYTKKESNAIDSVNSLLAMAMASECKTGIEVMKDEMDILRP